MPRPASQYRHIITIQKLDDSTQDSYGSVVETWSDYKRNIPADVETASGREYYQSNREVSDEITRFFIRFDPDLTITTKYRVSFNGGYYSIEYAPNFDHKNQEYIVHTIRRDT